MGNTVVWKPASTAAVLRLLPDAPLPGRRTAGRRDQPRLRQRRRDRRRRAREPRPRRRPLHRLDTGLPVDVEDDRRQHRRRTATTRGSSARPAARTSSSRTRPRTPNRSRRRSCAAASSTRARSALPRPASTSRRTSGTRCATGSSPTSARSGWATSADFGNFMGAVIDEKALQGARQGARAGEAGGDRASSGGEVDDSEGYFVQPTVIETSDPDFALMKEELFGPIVTAYVYDEKQLRGDARCGRPDRLLCAHGRGLLARAGADRPGAREAPPRRRQLLRQRQADRRRGRPAAVRRRAGLRHERQGRLDVEPDPVGQPADDQGDVRAADRLPLPVHGSWTATAASRIVPS